MRQDWRASWDRQVEQDQTLAAERALRRRLWRAVWSLPIALLLILLMLLRIPFALGRAILRATLSVFLFFFGVLILERPICSSCGCADPLCE